MNKTPLEKTIIELWHLSKTALAGMTTVPTRYDRMIYVKQELTRTFPELIAGLSAKKVWFAIEDVTAPTVKKIKLNVYKQWHNGEETRGPVQVDAVLVDVPFIKAFAYKEGKYWHVCELTTGLQIEYGYCKTMQDATDRAIEVLNGCGQEKTFSAIAQKKVINSDTDMPKTETPKVKVAVSYMNKGRCVTSSFEIETKEPQAIFDNAIRDANVFAATHNGQVQITRKVNSLYINYLNVKCDLIDRMYLISAQ